MRIAFVVGSLDISGGTYVIFQHASFLADAGHEVSLVVVLPYEPRMLDWHPAARSLEIVSLEAIGEREFDLAVATWWKTALALHRVRARQYAYFVQSIESRFFPDSDAPLRALVDSTYDLGLAGITEASWIQGFLERQHGVHFGLVPNGIRKDIYQPEGPSLATRKAGDGLRILVEGAFGVPFKNVGRTLKLMRRARVGETWLLTPSGVGSIPGVARVFSRMPIAATAPIYRACDVLVKLSYVEGMFGPPLEMFHCGGTAVVYGVTGYDEYIEHDKNALVVPPRDEDGVVAAVRSLRRDPALLERLQAGARETADRWPSWMTSSALFEQALDSIASAVPIDRSELAARSRVALQEYARERVARQASQPATRLRTAAHVMLDRLPEPVRSPLRHAVYILETR